MYDDPKKAKKQPANPVLTEIDRELASVRPSPSEENDAKLADSIKRGAKELGIDPEDYAVAMSYESGGSFDPWKAGPTTKWGQHRGTIQYGEPQRKQYGVYEGQSFDEQVTKSNVKYLRDAGVKPGMKFEQIYSAINGGSVNKDLNTQDWNTGRTIADNIRKADAEHRASVRKRFGQYFSADSTPSYDVDAFEQSILNPKAGKAGKTGPTPTFPKGSVAKVPPAPETPQTLDAQRQAMNDPQSTRAAVLYTKGEKIPPPDDATEFDVQLPTGETLRVNAEKYDAIEKQLGKPLLEEIANGGDYTLLLGGKAQPTESTMDKPAVVTRDAKTGTELVASSVEDQAGAAKEAQLQKAQFPNRQTVTQLENSDMVVEGRMQDQPQQAVENDGVSIDQESDPNGVIDKVYYSRGKPENVAAKDWMLDDIAMKVSHRGINFNAAKDYFKEKGFKDFNSGQNLTDEDLSEIYSRGDQFFNVTNKDLAQLTFLSGIYDKFEDGFRQNKLPSQIYDELGADGYLDAESAKRYGDREREAERSLLSDLEDEARASIIGGKAARAPELSGITAARLTGAEMPYKPVDEAKEYDSIKKQAAERFAQIIKDYKTPSNYRSAVALTQAKLQAIKDYREQLYQAGVPQYTIPLQVLSNMAEGGLQVATDLASYVDIAKEVAGIGTEADFARWLVNGQYDVTPAFQRANYQSAQALQKWFEDNSYNDDLLNMSVWLNDIPKVVTQMIVQTAVGAATGGALAPTVLGMAQGGVERYKEATAKKEEAIKAGATPAEARAIVDADVSPWVRKIKVAVASAAAVPEYFILGGILRSAGLVKGEKILDELLGRTAKQMFAKFAAEVGEVEAAELTRSALKGMISRIAKKGGELVKYGGYESIQETGEDKVNNAVAWYTHDRSDIRWNKVKFLTEDDLTTMGVSFVAGAGGFASGFANGIAMERLSRPSGKIEINGKEFDTPAAVKPILRQALAQYDTALETWNTAKLLFEEGRKQKTQEKRREYRQAARNAYTRGVLEFQAAEGIYGEAQKAATETQNTSPTPFEPMQIEDVLQRERVARQRSQNIPSQDQMQAMIGLAGTPEEAQAGIETPENANSGEISQEVAPETVPGTPAPDFDVDAFEQEVAQPTVEQPETVTDDKGTKFEVLEDQGKNVKVQEIKPDGKKGSVTIQNKRRFKPTNEKTETAISSQPAPVDAKPLVQDQSVQGETAKPVTPAKPRPPVKAQGIELTGKEAPPSVHKFSSTQANLPKEQAQKVLEVGKRIVADEDVYTDPEDPSFGREGTPHITVKYGLHTENADEVRRILAKEKPFTAKLGDITIFPGGENTPYDVVKADVDSPELHRLNKLIADNTEVTDTFPEYKPHVTLAYVKKGAGQKYVGKKDLSGTEIAFNSIMFSGKDGQAVEIPLKGETATEKQPETKKTAPAKAAKPTTPEAEPAAEPSDSDLFDDVIAEIREEQKPKAAEKDAYDEIAEIMGFRSVLENAPTEIDLKKFDALVPVFEKATAEFDGEDRRAQMKAFILKLNERFTLDQVQELKPYVMRFFEDQAKALPKTLEFDGHSFEVSKLPMPSKELEAIQEKTIREVLADPQGFIDRYLEKWPKEVNADNAKELFEEYDLDPLSRVSSVHKASSLVAELVFYNRLRRMPKGSSVLFSAGGGGSGKTYSIDKVIGKGKHDLVYDGVMKDHEDNARLLDDVLSYGHVPQIVAVFAPAEIAAQQNVRRSIKHRRLVPYGPLTDGHYGFQQTFAAGETYDFATANNIPIRFLENDGENTPVEISVEDFSELVYSNKLTVQQKFREATYEEISRGKHPKTGEPYDPRLRDAFDQRPIPTVDTRTTSGEQETDGRDSGLNDRNNGSTEPGRRISQGVSDDQRSNIGDDQEASGEKQLRTGDNDTSVDLEAGQSRETKGTRPQESTDTSDRGSNAGSGRSTGSKSRGGESVDGRSRDSADGGVAPARTNFRITNELDFERFSPKERYRKNVEAIRLVNTLENEGRLATPDEQKILAQYVGWGGLKQAFDPKNDKWSKEYAELLEQLRAKAKKSPVTPREEEAEILNSVLETLPDAFYSRVSSIVAEKMPNRATPSQVKALLLKNGVKELDPEFQMISLWLADQPDTVSRQEVIDFATANQVKVGSVAFDNEDTQFGSYVLPGEKGDYREEFITSPSPLNGWLTVTGYDADGKQIARGTVPTQKDAKRLTERYQREGSAKTEMSRAEMLGWSDGHREYPNVQNPVVRLRYNTRTTEDGETMLFAEEIQQPTEAQFAKMPKIYQKYGESIGLKKLLYRAAAEGYDRFGFTTGQQQVERYESAVKQVVDEVRWKRVSEDTVEVYGKKNGETKFGFESVNIDGETKFGSHPPFTLESLVGTPTAQKIRATPTGKSDAVKGDGLVVGGTNLAQRYNAKFPEILNKLLRPFGVQVEDVKTGDQTVHSVKITPELREAIMRGQPLFSTLLEGEAAESERMTIEEMRDLPFVPFDELLDGADAARNGSYIKVNAKSHEIYRRAFEQVKIEKGKITKGSPDAEDLFKGSFLDPKNVKDASKVLRQKAAEARELNYPQNQIKALVAHADALELAAKEGKGTAVLFVFDSALPHEAFHQADYMGSAEKTILNRHSDKSKATLDTHRVRDILWAKHFSRYNTYTRYRSERQRNAILRAEIPPYLLELTDKQLADLGITPEMRADYLLKWFEGYAEKNGIDSLDNFAREELNVQEFITYTKENAPAAVEDGGTRPADETDTNRRNDGTAETRGGPQSDRTGNEEPIAAGIDLGPGQKLRSLPKTMRAAGLDAIDQAYDVFHDNDATAEAERLLNENGIEGSINLLRNLKAEAQDAQHAILSFMLIRTLANHAMQIQATDPETAEKHRQLAFDLGREHAVKATQAGRFTRIPSVIGATTEHLIYAVQGIIEAKYEKNYTLSPEEMAKWEGLGRQLEAANSKIEERGREVRNLKAKIKRLQDEKEGKRKKRRSSSAGQRNRKRLVDLIKTDKRIAESEEARRRLLERFNPQAERLNSVLGGVEFIASSERDWKQNREISFDAQDILNQYFKQNGFETETHGGGVSASTYVKLRGYAEDGYDYTTVIRISDHDQPSNAPRDIDHNVAIDLRDIDTREELDSAIKSAIDEVETIFKENGYRKEEDEAEEARRRRLVDRENVTTHNVLSHKGTDQTPADGNNISSTGESVNPLKSVLDDEFPVGDFAEVGADLLTEGLAGEEEYPPSAFYAEMKAMFGDVIDTHWDEIYSESWAKRNQWLNEARYEATKERVENKYNKGEELEDWEIEEILGQEKEAAKRRREFEKAHSIASGEAARKEDAAADRRKQKGLEKRAENLQRGKSSPRDIKDLKRIINEIGKDNVNAAVVAIMIAEGYSAGRIYAGLSDLGVKEGADQRQTFRDGDQILQQARKQQKAEQDKVVEGILAAEGQLKTADDMRWEARNEARKVRETVAEELRRIKKGELAFKAGQVWDATNAFRTMMASLDLSAALRQGGFFMFADPEKQRKAIVEMFRSISAKGYGRAIMDIEANELFTLAQRAGIDFAMAGRNDADSSLLGEELYRGEQMIEKIPLLGPVLAEGIIKPSERTYTAFLDTQRMVMFNLFAKELMAAGKTFKDNPSEFRKMAEFVNIASGRGTMPANRWAKVIMELPLFAPRYTLSRLQLLNKTLNPIAYYNMPPQTRKIIAKQAARFYGTTMGILGLASLVGGYIGMGVNWDPDDDDFLKLSVGNTKYDIFAGLLQPAKLIIKLGMAAYRTKFGFDNRMPKEFLGDVMENTLRFGRGKLSPITGLAVDIASGSDYNNQATEVFTDIGGVPVPGKAIYSRLIPLTISDIAEAYKLDGAVGVARSTPFAFFGVGVNNYKPRPERPETDAEKLAVKMMLFNLPEREPRTAEDVKKSQLLQDLTARARRGEQVEAEIDKAIAEGMLREDQREDINRAGTMTLLEDAAESLKLEQFERVFRLATEKERKILLPMLDKKMKDADISGQLKPDLRKRLEALGGKVLGDFPMPDAVRREFNRLRIKTPDVGDRLTLFKGDKPIKLETDEYDKYRRETLERIYTKLEERMAEPDWQQLDEKDKRRAIDRIISKQRSKEQKETKREIRAESGN